MRFVKCAHSLLSLFTALLSLSPVLTIVAVQTDALQNHTLGIESSAVLFSTGWTTAANAAGPFKRAEGLGDEVQVTLPANTVAVAYISFKRTGGALYAACVDCGSSGQQLQDVNASDHNSNDDEPVVLFSFSGLDPSVSHVLQVVNSADPAFGNTSEITFKLLVVTITTDASSSTHSRTKTSSDGSLSMSTATATASSTLQTATTATTATSGAGVTSLSLSSDVSTQSTALSGVSTTFGLSSSASSTSSTSSTSSAATSSAGSISRDGLSTGTIVAAAVSSAAVVLLLFLAVFLLYRSRYRQLRLDTDSTTDLTRQISAPSVASVPFETPSDSYAPPPGATAFSQQSRASNVRRRSYRMGVAASVAMSGGRENSSVSTIPPRPRNPYEDRIGADVPLDWPGHEPRSPGMLRY